MNGQHSSEYDTSGLYRGAERIEPETVVPEAAHDARVLEDPAASVAQTVHPAASAVLMYSEYLLAVATGLPREQREILDLLRRQAHVVMWGLTAVAATDAARTAGARTPRAARVIA